MLRSLERYLHNKPRPLNSTTQDVYDLLVKTIQTTPKVVLCDAGANDELIEWLEVYFWNNGKYIVGRLAKNQVTA